MVNGPTPTFIFPLRNEGRRERAIGSTAAGLEEKFILALLTVAFFSPLFLLGEEPHHPEEYLPFTQTGSVLYLFTDARAHRGTIFRRQILSPLATNVEQDHFEN